MFGKIPWQNLRLASGISWSPGRNATVLWRTKEEMCLLFWKRGREGGDRKVPLGVIERGFAEDHMLCEKTIP